MEQEKKKGTSRVFAWVLRIFIGLAVLAAAGYLILAVYSADPYRADDYALEAMQEEAGITIHKGHASRDYLAFEADGAQAGLIFYPGGKVEYEAYAPLMHELARAGVTCIICKMPFNLAVLSPSAADGLMEDFHQITDWYIGGHSLGGAMASRYIAGHAEAYEGLVLLGAYPTDDLNSTDLKVLSIYGSEDRVLRREKFEEARAYVEGLGYYDEYVIDGGCHAFFGSYGPQKGDGQPRITVEEQTAVTARKILEMLQAGGR